MLRTRSTNFIDSLVAWSFDRPLSIFGQYLLAALVIVTVAVGRVLFVPDSLPWLLFIPATIGIALVTGRGPGLFAAVLSTMSGVLSIGSPRNPRWLPHSGWVAAILFLIVMLGLVAVVTALRNSIWRARRLNVDLIESERQAEEREAFLQSVFAASTDCIKVIELDGRLSFITNGGLDASGPDGVGTGQSFTWSDFLGGDGPDQARTAVEAAKRGGTTHFDAPAHTGSRKVKHWSVSISPILGADGKVARILSVSRDHTELHEAREEQHLLNGELAHRIKNTMSVVQAIAHQTLGKSEDQEAVAAFGKRLGALAAANDVLTRDNWSSASLGEVASGVLVTFGEERFALTGPDVTIGSRATLALTLMLHELATNAAKYGALSVPEGRVTVSWGVCEEGDKKTLHLDWVERGGPPAAAPTRKGFGSRIIRMGLSGSGRVDLNYEPEGLRMQATAPLHQIQEA